MVWKTQRCTKWMWLVNMLHEFSDGIVLIKDPEKDMSKILKAVADTLKRWKFENKFQANKTEDWMKNG